MEIPKLTFSLIIINIAIFLLVFSMPEKLFEQTMETFYFSAETSGQIWRWVTSLFLHASASHLFSNMLGLYFFGKILESETPRQWFLAIYFMAGFLGNFVFMFTSLSPVIGASGAMFGVMGAAMFLNPIKKVHIYVFPLPLGIVAITFSVFEALVVYFQPSQFSGVANIAHVAGIITGAVFAFFYAPKRGLKSVLVLIVLMLILIFLSPVFALIAGLGGIVIQILDFIIGGVLYTLASLLSFIWG